LPPGLQKRLEPLPVDLDRRLPRLPEYWERMVLERDVILIDRRTNRILDIIENIVETPIGAPIDQDHIALEHHPFPIFREPRQAPVQIDRQRLQALLQTWRELAVLFEVLLQTGRQISASLR